MKHTLTLSALVLLVASTVHAQQITVPSPSADITAAAMEDADAPQDPPQHPVAIEYSDGYLLRGKIHKYASFAMLPLFATEVALGQSLYNNVGTTTGSKRTAHGMVGAAIGGLFAVNTVTGVMNMWESRKDPAKRGVHLIHGLLMVGADAGFFLTATTTPSHGRTGLATFTADESTHRTIALTSMGIATAGYLIMLIGGR
jgi:hypothetical protein